MPSGGVGDGVVPPVGAAAAGRHRRAPRPASRRALDAGLAAAGQLGRTAAGIVMLAVIGATAALAAPHPPAEPGLARAPLAAPHGAPGQAHRILDEPPGAVGSSGAFTRHRMR